MSDVYRCNWTDCFVEGGKREIIWYLIMNHKDEEQVLFLCSLCRLRTSAFRTLERHCSTYRPHMQLQDGNNDDKIFLIKSTKPYFVKLGSNISTCDAVLEKTELVHESVLDIIEESVEFDHIDNSCQTDNTYESSRSLTQK